jgi:hypothetical protein
MAKSSPKKTHSNKFLLTLHSVGQYCKKIKGKFYYFGDDKQKAFERYPEQASSLHSGKSSVSIYKNDDYFRQKVVKK